MNIKFVKYIVCIALLHLTSTLVSCSDNDNYSPGKPTAEGAVGVYFASTNEADYILVPEDSVIELTVARSDSSEACSVPVHVDYSDTTSISVPESVYFEKGQGTQTLTIGINGLQVKKTYKFRLSFDENYADHYSVKNGTSQFDCSVVVSQWVLLKDSVEFYYIDHKELPSTYSQMYQLEGVNRFYMTNFMGSGASLYYSIKGSGVNPSKPNSWNGEIVPYEGMGAAIFDYSTYKLNYVVCGLDSDGYYIYNWKCNDVNIDFLDWYGGYSYGAYYSMIDYSLNYIYLYGYISSDVYSGFVGIYGVWK